MTSKRKKISESTKILVAGRQYFKCANNNEAILDGIGEYKCPLWSGVNQGSFDEAGFEIDHKIEHCLTKNDDLDNLQALCKSCHQVKSKMYQRSGTAAQLRKNKSDIKKLNTFTVPLLQDLLRSNNQKTTGKKSELIERIIELNLNINLSGEKNEIEETVTEDVPDILTVKDKKVSKEEQTKPKLKKSEVSKGEHTKPKLKKSEVLNQNKPNDDFVVDDYTLKQLVQICLYLEISPNGTKDKLTNKINKVGYGKEKCLKEMKNGKYMIKCSKLEKYTYHVYFTDAKLSNDNEPLINNHRKINSDTCPECKKSGRCILEYTNEFYK